MGYQEPFPELRLVRRAVRILMALAVLGIVLAYVAGA